MLLETDAPDALPKSNIDSLFFVEGDTSLDNEIHGQTSTSSSTSDSSPANPSQVLTDASMLPKDTLNHPANIHNVSSSSIFLHCHFALRISLTWRYIIVLTIELKTS